MQYNGPLDQPSNPNASYNNGNPAAGILGSVPPAICFEAPQRELVALIATAGLTPSNADLTQLTEALQLVDVCNVFKISGNSGSASAWAGAIKALPNAGNAPPTGTMVWFQPGSPSVSGGTTFQLNNYARAPVTLSDRSALLQGDVPSGSTWCLLFWDGTEWQLLAGSSRQPGGLAVLSANANWYVNGTTGSDTLYDGTSATVIPGTTHGPFATLQRAANQTLLFNMNGYSQNIHVADGTYAPVALSPTNGSGTVNFIGDTASPANCAVAATNEYGCAFIQYGGSYTYNGFRVSTGSNGLDGFALNGGTAILDNFRFGPCGRAHISSAWAGRLTTDNSTFTIEAGANAEYHLLGSLVGTIGILTTPPSPPSLVIQGAVTFSEAFVSASAGATVAVTYSSITGAGSVTGPRYEVDTNGVVASGGGGASYYPGSTSGSTTSGGQYV